jgi:hypothetical protein
MGKKKTSWRAEGVPAWNVGTEERTGYYTYWRRNKAWDISLEDLEKKKEGIERQSNKKESDARYQKQTRSQEYRKKTQAPTRPATDTTGGQLVNGTRTHHLLNPLIPNRLLICRLCLVLHFLLAHPIIISQLTNK